MLKCNPKFILLFFTTIITSCAPPPSFFKIEGTLNLRNKINKIVEESEIDLNMGIQITSLKNDKIIYDYKVFLVGLVFLEKYLYQLNTLMVLELT